MNIGSFVVTVEYTVEQVDELITRILRSRLDEKVGRAGMVKAPMGERRSISGTLTLLAIASVTASVRAIRIGKVTAVADNMGAAANMAPMRTASSIKATNSFMRTSWPRRIID
jgi:hypothetical protein